MTTAPGEHRSSRLPLLLTAGAILAIVVIAVIAVFAQRSTVSYPEDTPEGVVQRYAQAIVDGDFDAARGHLHSDVEKKCRQDEYPMPDDVRMSLVGTTDRGESTVVDVVMTRVGGGGLFGPSEYRYDARFVLSRDGDRWAITDMPWEFRVCTEVTS